jgi:hypothetical protein
MTLFRILDAQALTRYTGVSNYFDDDYFESDNWSWSPVTEDFALQEGAIEHANLVTAEDEEFGGEAFMEEGNYVMLNLDTGEAGDSLGSNLLEAVALFKQQADESSESFALLHVVAVA